jgi:hypothetical protein
MATRDSYGQYASPTRPAIVRTLKEQTDRHGLHEEADATEEISCTSGEESHAGLSAVS